MHTKLPDYSEYLKQPGMLAWIEDEWVKNPHIHDEHARIVNEFIEKYSPSTIIEVGCGTGQLATRLNLGESKYLGIDSNEKCIDAARLKNNLLEFNVADVRNYYTAQHKLIISFGFLKHFGLHEWTNIFNTLSCFGKYFIFDMPITWESKDDSINDSSLQFHHVWKSKQDMVNEIELANLELLEIINPSSLEPVFICKQREKK